MRGKRILVGVGGGIAAYKVATLVSRLVQSGADVDVAMTEAAVKFVAPLTFQALTHRPVYLDIFDQSSWGEGSIPHVELAARADLCVVAPATANLMARLAHGLADDFLTTTMLALRGPLLLAPAMDVGMFDHPATQSNVALLRQRGVYVVGPERGRLASGLEGLGRMSEPEDIFTAIETLLSPKSLLTDVRIVVTAGGTQEPIDPVRYIGNRSSGKMGYAIASVAAGRGAKVTLISGPTSLTAPNVDRLVSVTTTLDLQAAVREAADSADVVIMAAAVADYRVDNPADHKMKKTGDALVLRLVENPDILADLGARQRRPLLVGFAAETHDLLANASAKLVKKRADMLVANDVTAPGSGFGTDTNQAVFLYRDRPNESLPLMSKEELAGLLLDRVQELLAARP